MSVPDRITSYLANGGFFNPEYADHDRVRDLLIDARDEIERLQRIKVEAEHVLDACEEGRRGDDFDTILHQLRIALRGEEGE